MANKQTINTNIDTLQNLIKENLYEGKTFKNELELFRTLGLIESDQQVKGNQRIKLRKIVESYLCYEKEGQSVHITNIYDEPFELIDKRKEGKYVTFIEAVLLNYLSQQNNKTVRMSYRSLFEELGMVNENYYNYKYRNALKEKNEKVTSFESVNFFSRSYSFIKAVVDRALKILSERCLIFYSKNIVIIKKINVNDDIVQTQKHIANKDEISIIVKTERKILNEMEVKDKSQLFWTGRSGAFYEKVKSILEEKYGWINYYDEFQIIYGEKADLREGLNETLVKLNKMILNENIIESINKDAQNKKNRYDELFINELRQEWDEARAKDTYPKGIALCNSFETFVRIRKGIVPQYPDDYLEVQELLAKYFISTVPENQKALIEYIKENNVSDDIQCL